MKKILILVLFFAVVFFTMAAQANALTLDFYDDYYVGYYSPPEPADPINEVGYINDLRSVDAGDTDTIDSYFYSREMSDIASGDLPEAFASPTFKDESGATSITFDQPYEYVIGKYDGPNAGGFVWWVEGGVFDVLLPGLSPDGLFDQQYGLSHTSGYNVGSNPVPEPATMLLLGTGLVGLAAGARRRLKKA